MKCNQAQKQDKTYVAPTLKTVIMEEDVVRCSTVVEGEKGFDMSALFSEN